MSDEGTEQVVAEFPKNDREKVRVSVREWKRRRYGSIRVWFKGKAPDTWFPGKAGISLSVDLLPQLEQAIQKLREAVNGDGENVPF